MVKTSPLAISRILLKRAELGINLAKLRMTFRDTKSFDLTKGANCSCSRYWTKLDWFVPYVFVNANQKGEKVSNNIWFLWLIPFTLLLYYTTAARLLPYSLAEISTDDCDTHCWIIIGCLPIALSFIHI